MFGEVMKDLASEVNLKFHLDSIYDSDYEPFEANGHVVIGAYDGSAVPKKIHAIIHPRTCRNL